MSEAEGAVKVEEWQQTFYASDSGIQSGATTIRDEEESEFSKKYSVSASAAESATGNVFALKVSLCLSEHFDELYYPRASKISH